MILSTYFAGHEKHSNSRATNSSSSKDGTRDSATGSRHWSSSSSRDDSDVPAKDGRSRKHPEENTQASQDMDISPGDSTPTSEISYGNSSTQQTVEQNTLGPVLLANALPRLISHPVHMPSTPGGRSESSPQSTPSMLPVPTPVTISNAPGPPTSLGTLARIMTQTAPTDSNADKNSHGSISLQRQTVVTGDSVVHTSLSVDINHTGTIVDGPPTPTHSETPDCTKGRMSILNSYLFFSILH